MKKFELSAGRANALYLAIKPFTLTGGLKNKIRSALKSSGKSTFALDDAQAMLIAECMTKSIADADWRTIFGAPQTKGSAEAALDALVKRYDLTLAKPATTEPETTEADAEAVADAAQEAMLAKLETAEGETAQVMTLEDALAAALQTEPVEGETEGADVAA